MNYTQPNREHLFAALLFTRALSFLLRENEGVVVNLKGDMRGLAPETFVGNRVIVFRSNSQIVVSEAEGEALTAPEGTLVWVHR